MKKNPGYKIVFHTLEDIKNGIDSPKGELINHHRFYGVYKVLCNE